METTLSSKISKQGFVSSYERNLYIALSFTVMIDFINGIVTKIPLGEIYRSVILLYCVYTISRTRYKELGFVVIATLFYFFNSFYGFLKTNNLVGLSFDLKMVTKALYFIIIFKAVKSLIVTNKFDPKTIKNIILNNLYYTPFLFIISYILGIGANSYETVGIGFKGTFLSLNSINVALIVLFVFAFDLLLNSSKKIVGFFYVLATLLTLVLLGTKSSLIFIPFIIILFLLFKLGTFKWSIYTCTIFSFVLIVIFLVILIGSTYNFNGSITYLDELLYRQKYLFANRDLLSYLLSGRNWLLEAGWQSFSSGISLFRVIFGYGYFHIHNNIAIAFDMPILNSVRPIELDMMDIFFSYGIIGLSLSYGFFFKWFAKGFKNVTSQSNQPYFIALLSLLIFSLTGGHVFLEAISSTFLGLLLAGWYANAQENDRVVTLM